MRSLSLGAGIPEVSRRVAQTEFVITEIGRSREPVAAVFERVAARLAAARAEVLSMMLFAPVTGTDAIERAMHAALGPTDWPITWVQGASCDASPIAGVQVVAVSARDVARVRLGPCVVASVFVDDDARHCVLGGLGPNSLALRAPAQVQQLLGNLECALDLAGFELADVVRTWFYNEEILSWYDDFNRVRSAHYASVRWRSGSIPASTGVAGSNRAGAKLAAATWAMRPLRDAASAREIASPLQCPAPHYGSSFSRAMEVISGGLRRLFISGTASIHPDGRTAFAGNPGKQIELTMEVVGAILQSRGMDFQRVTRATAYFQRPQVKPLFDAWRAERGLTPMPVVPVHCDICREDLLFEIEVDAAVEATA